MSGLIGPRRAMLLLSVALIGIGWYFKDYQIEILGPGGNTGAIGIIVGIALIFFVMFYSTFMNNCM